MFNNKNEKLEAVFKLILMFLAVIVIFFLLGRLKKEEEKPEISYTKENIKENEKKKKTESLYPDLTNNYVHNVNINSLELNQMVSGDLKAENIGKIYTEYDGYKDIFEKGIKIKETFGKTVAIRFNKEYTENIIGNVNANSSKEKILENIGSPNLETENILVYILENVDVIFNLNTNEVHCFLNNSKNIEEYFEIIEFYEKFQEDKNIKDFISNVTKTNPRYYRYEYDKNNVLLDYIDLGVRINFNSDKNIAGLFLFDNFFTNELENSQTKRSDIKDKIENMKQKNLIYIENKRLSYVEELEEKDKIKLMNEKAELIKKEINFMHNNESLGEISEDTLIYYEKNGKRKYENIVIKSKTNRFPVHYLNSAAFANDIIFADDHIIYAVDKDGIYYKKINEMESEKVYEPENGESIYFKHYDKSNRILEFNNIAIKIPN